MSLRMLIDGTQPEEVRVVVPGGDRIEDFDNEVESRNQLKGNIYLAKVTRVEPSLQAAFVDYGGNRHGFLPFSEIHPDYYQIPISDRQALMAAEEAAMREAEEREEAEAGAVKDQTAPVAADPVSDPVMTGEPSSDAPPMSEASDAAISETEVVGLEGAGVGEVKEVSTEIKVDSVGGDEIDDAERRRARMLRRYKIQEVIKRGKYFLYR